MLYLDSSALAKLVIVEHHTGQVERLVEGRTDLASAALARVEVSRVGRVHGGSAPERALRALERLELIGVDERLLDAAAALAGPRLKSLDAIHVAAAQALGNELEALVTYDRQMQDAAQSLGLPVAAPT